MKETDVPFMRPFHRALTFAFACFACGNAQSAESTPGTQWRLTEIPIEQLVGMEVVSASNIANQISHAPSAVSIVTGDEIRAFGYHTLAEVLESMRGLHITRDRAYAYLGGRGFGRPGDFTGRIMLMIDGREFNNNVYSSGNLEYAFPVDPSLIDRVEYISGPGSIIHGNTAFYGIINVITKKGHDINGVQVIGEIASHNAKEGKLHYGKRFDNGAEILLSASGFQSPGQTLYFPESAGRPIGVGGAIVDGVSRDLDEQRSQRLFGKVEWESWFAEIAYAKREKDIPTAPYGADFNAPYYYDDSYLEGSLKHDRRLNDWLNLSLHGYFGRYEYRGLATYSGTPWRERSEGKWWGLNAQFAGNWREGHRLLFGADLRADTYQEIITPVSHSDTDETTLSLYMEDEITLTSTVKTNIGARYDINSETDERLSPRVALIYTPQPSTTLKLSHSRAYRRANPFEKYYTDGFLLPNPSIKPERIDATELVFEHRPNQDTKWLGTLYHYKASDFIRSEVISPGFSHFTNIKGNTTNGAELEFEQHWSSSTLFRASVAYQHAEDGHGNWPANSPRVIGKLNYMLSLQPWVVAMELQGYGSRKTEHATEIGGYSVANLTVSSNRLIPNCDIALGVRNLFDRDYKTVAPLSNAWQTTLPQDGRTYWLRLTYDLK